MVMHPSPGHYSGTLVNALLHHCGLPPMRLAAGDSTPLSLLGDGGGGRGSGGSSEEEGEEGDEGEESELEESDEDSSSLLLLGPEEEEQQQGQQQQRWQQGGAGSSGPATIRPGIVHRLDKGTTGLLVVAKNDATHLSLAAQFKDRVVQVGRAGPGRVVLSRGCPTQHMLGWASCWRADAVAAASQLFRS